MAQCGAHNRDGSPCGAQAMEGHSVCRMHGAGGHSVDRGGRPRVHGAYARRVKPEEEGELQELRSLGVSLEDEVALARLQLARTWEWADQDRAVECDGKHCPYRLIDSRLSLVSRLAVRCQRITEGAVALMEEDERVQRVVEVIEQCVTDPEVRARIARRLQALGDPDEEEALARQAWERGI